MVKNLPSNSGDARDMGLIPESGRFTGEENGNPFQYSCLGNPMEREGWWATVYGITKSWTWLSVHGTDASPPLPLKKKKNKTFHPWPKKFSYSWSLHSVLPPLTAVCRQAWQPWNLHDKTDRVLLWKEYLFLNHCLRERHPSIRNMHLKLKWKIKSHNEKPLIFSAL